MKRKQGIQQKLTRLILLITILALLVSCLCSIIPMLIVRKQALDIAVTDAKDRLAELADSRASLADAKLQMAQNQTLSIAEGMAEILSDPERYLMGYGEVEGREEVLLPNLTGADSPMLGKYYVQIRVPYELLKEESIVKDSDGTVIKAELDRDADTGGSLSVNEQLYLSSKLSNEFAQIEKFRDKDGEFSGFSASYFCFADSGIDVLGDPKTTAMIEYDARTRDWYQGALEAYKNGTLTDAGVYWTEPVQDGSGRGISMICSAPVVVDGEVVGVAGSGGLLVEFADLVKSSAIGTSGFSVMIDRNTSKVIINPNITDKTVKESEIKLETDLMASKNPDLVSLANKIKAGGDGSLVELFKIDGKEYYLAYSNLTNNNWTMVTLITANDDLIMGNYNNLNNQILMAFMIFFVLISIVIVLTVIISSKYSKYFTKPILALKSGVSEIGAGNLDHALDIKTGDEIEELGDAFNAMAQNLEKYIENLSKVTAEKERIGAELDVATKIQASMLPCIFPAFPEREEFDIYATMDPAKEVGGDFYDFFMIDEDNLAVVIADVSGKGIPAALFMVIGKTLIKDHTTPGKDLGEVFTEVNELLIEANSEEMFITAFVGVLNLKSGEFRYVNAGHEIPFISRAGGDFAPHKIRAAFVLAGMEGMKYKAGVFQLEPGDKIFEYTDGVTEATDKDNRLFGMERLQNSLNSAKGGSPDKILAKVKEDIDGFVGEADQFDDITMLCLEFKKRYGDNQGINAKVSLDSMAELTEYAERTFEAGGAPMSVITKMNIALDEIFSNIVKFSGASFAKVTCGVENANTAYMIFADDGAPYNPLEQEDPDITLSAEERSIGGLGIFMVKKSMTSLTYEYAAGNNNLTLKLKF